MLPENPIPTRFKNAKMLTFFANFKMVINCFERVMIVYYPFIFDAQKPPKCPLFVSSFKYSTVPEMSAPPKKPPKKLPKKPDHAR